MSESVLEIKNVSKYYGKNKVVDNVSFSVEKGQILGFLGPNGAGKTTTIKMILGLLSIDEGSIKVNGFDVKKNFEKAMEYIGGIVENPDMYGYMSAVDNLKLFAKIRNINYSEVYKVLELVGLKKSMNQKVSKYSLGMKQRAGLALSLLHSPKVLILDEPTNGLDPVGIKELRDILKKLARENGTAILVSSHILSEMELMCDKVAVINQGKIVKVESLKENEEDNTNEVKTVQCVLKVKTPENAINIIKEKLNKQANLKDGKVYVAMSDKLLFQSGSARLDKRGEEALGKLAEVLNKQTDIDVFIEGHTDNKPINTVQFKDNWDLSVIRATSVVRILIKNYGVNPLQIQPSGRGEYMPVDDNETAEGRSKNRRTEIIMAPKLDKLFQMLQTSEEVK